jgi:hypothetical protein
MLRIIRESVLLCGALSMAIVAAGQQSMPQEKPHSGAIDLAVTSKDATAPFTPEGRRILGLGSKLSR